MDKYHKNLFFKIVVLITLFFIATVYVVYSKFEDYAIEENQAKELDYLMHHKALHSYVENTLKPVIYDFQHKQILNEDYFNPKLLSFTYISRQIVDEYNKVRKEYDLEPIYYKLASDNPRNDVNVATKDELDLLKKFNNGEIKTYTKQIIKENKPYIYYAMPVGKTKESCMRCHSEPEKAPKDLIDMYGDKKGFGEKVDNIRAFISLHFPLTGEIEKMQKIFSTVFTILIIMYFISIAIAYYVIKQLNDKNNKLKIQAEFDALTNVYNRYKFNTDLDNLINSRRDENIHMLMLDIDHFKKINDTFGHPVGDKVLKELSTLILTHIRPSDRFYRIGGEEFVILCLTEKDCSVDIFAKRINDKVRNAIFSSVNHLTVSIGCTKFIKNETSNSFYQRCDKALYKAKENGRDCVEQL